MKKLVYPQNTIAPFWLKDLEYMQEGFEDVIKGIIEGLSLGAKDLIISGCKITYKDSKISMTSGWCYYGGEILPVKALAETACTTASPKIYFVKNTGYDPSGSRLVYKEDNSQTQEVYKNEYLSPRIVSSGTVLDYRLAISQGAWDLGDRIANKNRLKDSGTVFIEAPEADAINGGFSYRQIGCVVQLYGQLRHTSAQTGVAKDTLPKPLGSVRIAAGSGYISIDSEGMSFPSVEYFDLSCITYLSDAVNSDEENDGHYSALVSGDKDNVGNPDGGMSS